MKNNVLLLIITLLIISCSKEHEIKRELKGKYKISQISLNYEEQLCGNEQGNYTLYQIENPGTLIFTGEKTIQSSYLSKSHKTYVGYFDYEYSIIDSTGFKREQSEKSIFQYEMVTHKTGDFDTIKLFLIDDLSRRDLIPVKEGTKVTKFRMLVYNANCYRGYEDHIVE